MEGQFFLVDDTSRPEDKTADGEESETLTVKSGSSTVTVKSNFSPLYGFPRVEEYPGGELGAAEAEVVTPRHGAQPMGHRTHETEVIDIMSREDGALDPTPVIGRARNRQSEVVKIVAGMAREFAKALENRSKGFRRPLPVFEGNRYEDSRTFVSQMEAICEKEQIPEEEWGKVVADQFRVDAYKWYDPYRYFGWSCNVLREQLFQKFDGEGVQAKLQAELYGARQGEEEEVVVFIAKKVALFKRLRIVMTEEGMIRQIRPLIEPEISLHMVGVTATSIVRLTAVASEIETHLRETRPIARNREPRQEVARTRQNVMRCYGCGGDHVVRNCPQRASGPSRTSITCAGNSSDSGKRESGHVSGIGGVACTLSIRSIQTNYAGSTLPRIQVRVGCATRTALIDTGATHAFLRSDCYEGEEVANRSLVSLTTGEQVVAREPIRLDMWIEGYRTQAEVYMLDDMDEELILGMEWLKAEQTFHKEEFTSDTTSVEFTIFTGYPRSNLRWNHCV